MKLKRLLFFSMLLASIGSFAQNTSGPTEITDAIFRGKTQPFSTMTVNAPENRGVDEMILVPNRYEGSFDNLVEGRSSSEATLQTELGPIQAPDAIETNFLGIGDTGFNPPDPTGAAGPNHYVQAVNASIAVFSKTGDLLQGPVALGDFFETGNNNGDPIVLYDQLADRWIVSQFGPPIAGIPNSLLFAVSETADPLGSYFIYEILGGTVQDYPHYSIWPDGYYLTTNGSGGGGELEPREVYVLEREAMLTGNPDAQVIGLNLTGQFANPTTIFSPASANLLGTDFPENTSGYFVYLQDDAWDTSVDVDKLLVWETSIDWDTPENSTIAADPQEVIVDPFDSLFAEFGIGEISQPGTTQELAGQGGIISYMANYRSFEDHNSWLITFNVDVDGSDTSGIRWIELRNTDQDDSWTLFQEGTYAPADGNSRFMSSAGMDVQGNIGLAFNIAGSEMPVGIRHTGRFNGDPLGQMTIAENTIFDGPGIQNISQRFGDYAHTTLDPDQLTFWHTSQYFSDTNDWATRISSFRISNGFTNDVGVSAIVSPQTDDLSDEEVVEVIIRNFGTDPQSNIPLELRLDGVLVASEVFTETLLGGETASFIFTPTLDLNIEEQTYTIAARTVLNGDEAIVNDEVIVNVTHLIANDVGIVQILSPVESQDLGVEEVTVRVTNFGVAQSNFEVQYILDDQDPVIEIVTDTIATNTTVTFTFATAADLSALGFHTLSVTTNLPNDQNPENDAIDIELLNICMPDARCEFDDGVSQLTLADQSITPNCGVEPRGYSNDTDILFDFESTTGVFEGVLQVGFTDSVFAIWIDFNDNAIFEPNELIANDFVADRDTDFPFTVDFSQIEGVLPGTHLMRVRGEDESGLGDVLDPCGDLAFGRTNDYLARIPEGPVANDVGISSISSPQTANLSDTETVEVTIENFGTEDQSNIPVELRLDNVLVASEVFTGSLASGDMVTYVFSETLDLNIEGQTYVISVTTALAGDEVIENDEMSIDVTHLVTVEDVGVSAILAPISSEDLGMENVTIEITNFGDVQSNFEVAYTLDDQSPVVEVFTGEVPANTTVNYTFSTQVDLSNSGFHTLSARTNLVDDQNPANDALTISVLNTCIPTGDCMVDGVTQLVVADQSVTTNCGSMPAGYSNDTDIEFDFGIIDAPVVGTLQMGAGNSTFAIWIDFNDNGIFEADELIASDTVETANSDVPFTINFQDVPGATSGSYLMRVRGKNEAGEGDVLNPCDDLSLGRTNDYMAVIQEVLSTEDQLIQTGEFVVSTLGENRFDINFETSYDGPVFLGVFNLVGQQLKLRQVAQRGTGYGLRLDMSAMSTGVYILRISGQNGGDAARTAKIIVQ